MFTNKLNDLIDSSTHTITNYNNRTEKTKQWITDGMINSNQRRNKPRYLSICNPNNIERTVKYKAYRNSLYNITMKVRANLHNKLFGNSKYNLKNCG